MEFLQEEFDEILNIFQQEGGEILQSMDKNLLILEKKPNNIDVAMQLFRDAHSLKGSARMLGFNSIQNIAHKIEDILGLVKEEKLIPTSYITDTISNALSCVSMLIEKTIEQKAEYTTDEVNIHIKKLEQITEEFEENSSAKTVSEKEAVKFSEMRKKILKHLSNIEDYLTGIIFIYSKCAQENDFSQIGDMLPVVNQLSEVLFEIGLGDMDKIVRDIIELLEKSVLPKVSGSADGRENKRDESILELNLKINELVQYFNGVCKYEDIKAKNYYENAYKLISKEPKAFKNEDAKDTTPSDKLKEKELLELIKNISEKVPTLLENKINLAEIKSLINETISRIEEGNFKKIFITVLRIIAMYENNNTPFDKDTIAVIKEIAETAEKIIQNNFSKNSFKDSSEDIELLNQKAIIIEQMVQFSINSKPQIQNKKSKTKIKMQQLSSNDWLVNFDTTAIKTLRVDSSRLDQLVNQIGDLIVTRIKTRELMILAKNIQNEFMEWQKNYHKVGYYMKFFDKKYLANPFGEEAARNIQSFIGYNKQLMALHSTNSERMNALINSVDVLMKQLQENNSKLYSTSAELESMVKKMRILPLSTVFGLFPRMVHNIAKDKGKEIDFQIEGADVSADKKIIEDIKIPIMHIIRNSIDHGIETPDEREKAGKNRVGSILIQAIQKESKIIINIKDDGRGIDVEKIKQRAIEKELLSSDEIENLPEEQIVNLIFYPGFSTGDTVTELSGRGLGLDIVHTKISQLNGRIDVYSELNKGTLVTMELPTTIATLRTFIIMEQGQLYALPASSIQTVLRIDPHDVFIRDGKNQYIHNGEVIQVYTLSQILELENKPRVNDKYTLVIVQSENSRLGIIIEKLIGDQEILHKKLSPPLFKVKNIAGITTLASGEMCLILNMTDVLNTTISRKVATNIIPSVKSSEREANAKKKILVVDDSLTTRTLEKNILLKCGYQVEAASDPQEAIKLLENNKFDLIITDHEMPFMTGFEFVKYLKTINGYSNVPVIVLTSIKKTILEKLYEQLDISDFIQKENFEQSKFLETIQMQLKKTK